MSGRIDPLLPGDDEVDPRASGAVDVTALFELHRVRLLRLASAITLDRVLAEEVVHEALISLQKHIGNVADPVGQLQRTVVDLATSPASAGGKGLAARSRRKLASRRPDLVAAHFDRLDHVAAWDAFAAMTARERAVLVLARWRDLDEADIADALAWPRRRVRRCLHAALGDIGRIGGGTDPPAALATGMLEVAMPQLVSGEEPPADVSPPPDHTPTGRTALRLFVPKEPKRHRVAWVAVAVVLLGVMVGTVTYFSRQQGDLLPMTDATPPEDAALVEPEWYAALRPHLPDRFDRLALVALDDDRIGYVAIESSSGRSLEIEIVRPPDTQPSAPDVGVTDVPDGFRMLREDGSSVEVSCSLCGAAVTAGTPGATESPNVRAIAVQIAQGFELGQVDSGFGQPSEMRTDLGDVASAVAESMPGSPPVQLPAASEQQPAPGATDEAGVTDEGERFDGGATGGVVESMIAADDSMSILVVHGVFPAPDDVLRPPITNYDGGLVAGWVIDPDGTATRVVALADEAVPAEPSGQPIETLLDALGEIAASA